MIDITPQLTFPELIAALSHMSGRVTMKEKLNFAYHLFDEDNNGALGNNELFCMLRTLTGRTHSDSSLQAIVNNYMSRFPDGIDFDIFTQMFDISDLSKLTLEV